MVAPFPLFHMGAWTMAMQQWQAREAMVFATTDPAAICDAIERHQARRVHCLPGIWRRVLEHLDTPEGRARDLSSVEFADAATSATPIELLAAVDRALPNAKVRVFYGSTEAGSVSWLPPDDMYRKPGSVGVPAILTETRVDPGGELLVRGPLLFDGYLDDPEATAAALEDGWYHTGDVVDVDDEGYLSIVGRARDVIRTGGETVAPPEVEAVLGTYPGVADVAVIGLPDPAVGRGGLRGDRFRTRRARTHPRRPALVLREPPRPVQAAPAGRGDRRHPPHPRHPAGPASPPDRPAELSRGRLRSEGGTRAARHRDRRAGHPARGPGDRPRRPLRRPRGAALRELRRDDAGRQHRSDARRRRGPGRIATHGRVGVVGDRDAPRLLQAHVRAPAAGQRPHAELVGVRARRSTATPTWWSTSPPPTSRSSSATS